MLPLSLLKASEGHPVLIELKNGESYNGKLESIDKWMNMKLVDVLFVSRSGEKFLQVPECFVRGNTVKYVRVSEEALADAKQYEQQRAAQRGRRGRGRGGRGMRGGRGGRGRGTRGRGRGGRGRGRGGGAAGGNTGGD
ncbi:MAG: hypothetical protein MHM6MM_004760 [Cercozoa sp. M6MM]